MSDSSPELEAGGGNTAPIGREAPSASIVDDTPDFGFKRIADAIHGTIGLSQLEVDVLGTPVFQRLRHVKQLGLAHLVFPGADYSRFAHSVGVCHVAGRTLEAIRRNSSERIDGRGMQRERRFRSSNSALLRQWPTSEEGVGMESSQRAVVVNEFLSAVYQRRVFLSSLLTEQGFTTEQVERLYGEGLEPLATAVVELAQAQIKGYAGGERLWEVICRRFGLDGQPGETLQVLGDRLGISRERVRQLESKALQRCRGVAFRRLMEAGVRSVAAALLSGAPLSSPAPARPSSGSPNPERSGEATGAREGRENVAAPPVEGARKAAAEGRAALDKAMDALRVDQVLRQAIINCWDLLSEEERSLRGLKNEIRRRLRRAYGELAGAAGVPTGQLTAEEPDGARKNGSGCEAETREPGADGATPAGDRIGLIRRRYANAYRPWTAADDDALEQRFGAGEGVAALALIFQRQPSAIRSRLRKLGLME